MANSVTKRWQEYHAITSSWTPVSLRKSSLAALFVALCMSILGLELVNWKIRELKGLSADNKSAVLALHYVPTVVMILIGFAWKGVTSDFCMVLPWAVISGKWRCVPERKTVAKVQKQGKWT